MISRILKSYFSDIPWLFNQTSLPQIYQELKGPLPNRFMKTLTPGFLYAFDSLLDSLADSNLNHLENFMEPSLCSRVKQGLENMKERGLKFERLHREEPKITPLFVSFHSGISLERSKNPKENEIETRILNDEVLKLVKTLKQKSLYFMASSEFKRILNNTYMYGGNHESNVIISIDVAFHGKQFLGLDERKGDLEYHVIKFEAEILKMDFKERIGNNTYRHELMSFLSTRSKIVFDEFEWIVSDIDNIMNGNSFLRK